MAIIADLIKARVRFSTQLKSLKKRKKVSAVNIEFDPQKSLCLVSAIDEKSKVLTAVDFPLDPKIWAKGFHKLAIKHFNETAQSALGAKV